MWRKGFCIFVSFFIFLLVGKFPACAMKWFPKNFNCFYQVLTVRKSFVIEIKCHHCSSLLIIAHNTWTCAAVSCYREFSRVSQRGLWKLAFSKMKLCKKQVEGMICPFRFLYLQWAGYGPVCSGRRVQFIKILIIK